jgi:hypothetical protein
VLREGFDIDGQVILEAIQAAFEKRLSYEGKGYPKQIPGIIFWAELVQEVLEAVLSPNNSTWKRDYIQNKPYLINDALKRVIFFANAKDVTMRAEPKVKSLGKVTERMIKVNPTTQRELFDGEVSYPQKSIIDSWKDEEFQVWALLYEVHPESRTVNCEISKPIWVSDISDCYFDERYTLPSFTYQESTSFIPDIVEPAKTVEIEVSRRSDTEKTSETIFDEQNNKQ